ncbi:hypothetical protein [uncultured Duncaniella sp.]|jgi:hypothetical protein|uniref:hypothetical protein n=1 Tax=uncultured Duncaniella sp. TaxID=2768039 RepID=UPI0025B19309|nr:hypothetical protein [uncultured Duncaniella sp.]
MAATDLTFTQNAQGHYEANCTSLGDRIAVDLNRTKSGTLLVYGSIGDLEKSILFNFGPGSYKDLMFEIDVPADVKLTLVSYTEVTAAKITGV